MASVRVSKDSAPALGDLRLMGDGDTLRLETDVRDRRDWGRYLFVIAEAVARGAEVRWPRCDA
jgi:hypothetical protein